MRGWEQREHYRPIRTPLSPTSHPIDVARGLLSVYPFSSFYIADLDAIAGAGNNDAALAELKANFPHSTFWVDNGIADRASARTVAERRPRAPRAGKRDAKGRSRSAEAVQETTESSCRSITEAMILLDRQHC